MGGRGASSGGRYLKDGTYLPYGSEYKTILKSGNIKFVKSKGDSANAPKETMTKGRVYVTVNTDDKLKFISYYDMDGKKRKTIDLTKPHNKTLPHTHHGYEHSEGDSSKGYANLTPKEKKMVEKVQELWYNRNNKQ